MISAVILTKNEEENIEKCLKSLRWCDEIVIVDDCSKDKTIDRVRNLKSRIKNIKVHKRRCKRGSSYRSEYDFSGTSYREEAAKRL